MEVEFLRWAIRFHGHLGPFLVLGVKAGLRAVEVLGWNPLKMRAIIYLKRRNPYTCFLDGVQFSTGCTLGKGNIEVFDGDGIRALFRVDRRGVELEVRKEVLDEVEGAVDGPEEIALRLLSRNIRELFAEKPI